jgi:hypothetical protein
MEWHYVFDAEGRLISKETFKPKSYGEFPEDGESVIVPMAPWLWVFSNPFISWAMFMTGMVMAHIAQRAGKGKAAS